MPFMDKGVGSAWGLPVIAAGKERFSALSLSEKLQAPGIVSFGADPFRAEHLRELEALGIGPLGRYLGGEPIKPVKLKPEDFFCAAITRPQTFERTEKKDIANAAELFCNGLEFVDTYWPAGGSPSGVFKNHLEFLRTWGFSGGISIDEAAIAPLLAEYILFLQKETAVEKPKIVVLLSKHFHETQLSPQLQNAKVSADPAAGEIPVNFSVGNVPVLSREMSGTGIVLYEDIAPMLLAQKARCDILIAVNTGSPKNRRSDSVYAEEITARLKLTISAEEKKKQKKDVKKENTLKTFLFRDCNEESSLPFPASPRAGNQTTADFRPDLVKTYIQPDFSVTRETAAVLELLPQWEASRVEKAGGCLFAVNTRFSGLHAADFKEEQALFYYNDPAINKTKQNTEPHVKPAPPPIRNNASFIGLNQTQLEFFLRWRNECRLGNIRIIPGSMYMETYVRLYAEELALCMGKEGPMQHFTALLHLYNACTEHYPETANLLCKYCLEFAVVYGIGAEAFPILLNELLNNGWFGEMHSEIEDTEELLLDLGISYFFTEAENNFGKNEYWPLIKRLIPPKLLARKDNQIPPEFFHTLEVLDTQLRQDWNRSFFTLFFPPQFRKSDCRAFEGGRFMGDSSYTVFRPGFLSHKPLLDILSALALEPDKNPLPGVKARLNPLSLENELIEELRKESDEVREMLKLEDNLFEGQTPAFRSTKRAGLRRQARIEQKQNTLNESNYSETAYTPVNKITLMEFIGSLKDTEQNLIKNIMQGAHTSKNHSVSDTDIDAINVAFYEQFGDLLIETAPDHDKSPAPSIFAEYAAILKEWE